MAELSRRSFVGASMAGGVAALGLGGAEGTAFADAPAGAPVRPPDAVTVLPDDPRYPYLTTRGANRRFTGTPAEVRQVFTAEEVRQAVEAAVGAGQRIAVRSGGHCLDRLVDDPAVRMLIDVSQLKNVYYDPRHNAFAVESGAMLGDVYKALLLAWGVVVPGGTCPTVGVGGFVQGGGFGSMSRQYGMCVDHLYGVEVVVVDASGAAKTVVATRDPADPHHDLWWAHTGSGGGNYGVVTRYLFRSPDAKGTDPSALLPAPPKSMLVTTVSWPWSGLSEGDFVTLLTNHGAWHAANSADGGPYASLNSALVLDQPSAGAITLVAEMDGTLPDATGLMNDYVAALNAGVGAKHTVTQTTMPWLQAQLASLFGGGPSPYNRGKAKAAYLRQPYTAEQFKTVYDHLNAYTYSGVGALLLFAFGGKVNTLSRTATANPHRDSILISYLASSWADPAQDDDHIAWVRSCYGDLYAATGGVPAPGPATDGSYINYPDIDLADPEQNTSGTPWSTLYFGENYARLQQIKKRYDPGDVFRHALSVALPD
ncbi:FAD-binding protein [Streptomyces sp. NBC_00631]|uniref:FAD-binding oxidoreductase n=1 Tax=Streptomyces sp. NBC_00631 TaxID=2975793 RepID=UPI0030E0F567